MNSHARLVLAALLTAAACPVAFAWGDEGHEVIALIALHELEPSVLQQIDAMLATDVSHVTPSIAMEDEATWASKYRYNETQAWHFVEIEIDGSASLDQACFGHPALPRGMPASQGTAQDCIVDKIEEFTSELKDPGTPAREQLLALQFLLHFVGDIHQPLHASDDHDSGGNAKEVHATAIARNTLHHDWDVEFVNKLGPNATTIAARLIATITPTQERQWASGDPKSWALESFQLSKRIAYKLPQPSPDGTYELSTDYVKAATAATSQQLSRAGVRLAVLLNQAVR